MQFMIVTRGSQERHLGMSAGQRRGYKTEWLEESGGEEAGLKSPTVRINGPDAYRHDVASAYLKFAGDGVLIMLYKSVNYFWKGLSQKPNISTEVSTVCCVDSRTVCKSHRSRIRAAGCGG
jgi:hypothetical protein